jgi:hypothetical protein
MCDVCDALTSGTDLGLWVPPARGDLTAAAADGSSSGGGGGGSSSSGGGGLHNPLWLDEF